MAALNTIIAVAGDQHLRGIQMTTIWKLLETCIIPIITYGSETWDLNKAETKQMNRILDNILKRILMVPTSTPREALYMELKILDIEHIVHKTKINMYLRLKTTANDLILAALNTNRDKSWTKQTETILDTYQIPHNTTNTKTQKTHIKKSIQRQFQNKIRTTALTKSKTKFLVDNDNEQTQHRHTYLNTLNRKQCSTIFKARTRMLPVKINYKKMHKNLKCRGCNTNFETQDHILNSCRTLHPTNRTKVYRHEIFHNNCPNKLSIVAQKIDHTIQKLLNTKNTEERSPS